MNMCDEAKLPQKEEPTDILTKETTKQMTCTELCIRAEELGIQGRVMKITTTLGKGIKANIETPGPHGHQVNYGHNGIVSNKPTHKGRLLGPYDMVSVRCDEPPVIHVNPDGSETITVKYIKWNVGEYKRLL